MNIGISSMGMYNKQSWENKINNLLLHLNIQLDFTVHYAEGVDDLDLLIFDGGSDVNPKLYGQRGTYTTFWNDERDSNEKDLFLKFLKKHTLYAGICRGLQFLNIMYGGTLVQDIYYRYEENHFYIHEVSINNKEAQITNYVPNIFEVNSLHHQSVDILGNNCIATLLTGKIIEGIETKDDKVRAVQCHPEINSFNESYNLLRYILRL